jgi:predicted nuclease of predicted toxin-antitoxin system
MQFIANENIPLSSIVKIREYGYNVTAIIEEMPGVSDAEVLSLANREQRIVLTFDRDYGELIFRLKLPQPSGVIYFRFVPKTPEEPAEYILRFLVSTEITFENKFTIIERDRIRQRPL